MGMIEIASYLGNISYPGRGILLGKSGDGKSAVIAYFIMGRSQNSRNRVFVECGGGIKTQAHDPAQLSDPSLIIYSPVRVFGSAYIVTNGDQTDTIYDALTSGSCFEDALRTREFEPDGPNFTPRISGVVNVAGGAMPCKLSILKSEGGPSAACERFFFDYPALSAGEGRLIHTYEGDGSPLPSFLGEPRRVAIASDIDGLTGEIWNSLDGENKVSLFVRFIELASGAEKTRIINKLK